jgi:hypothetical protein
MGAEKVSPEKHTYLASPRLKPRPHLGKRKDIRGKSKHIPEAGNTAETVVAVNVNSYANILATSEWLHT